MRRKRILIGGEELYRMRADAKLNDVSEQIGQPQPDCECQDDRNSNERKHPFRVMLNMPCAYAIRHLFTPN